VTQAITALSPFGAVPSIRPLREANIEMTRLYLRSSVAAGQPWARGDGLEKRLLQAAEGGDARAQYNLGILYGNGLDDNGHTVEANRPQAVRWLLAAAEQGLPRAQAKLAEAYADGPDVSGRHATACGWFLLAAMGLRGVHLHGARSGYERIASHLTAAQIAKARCFARDWTPKRPKQAVDRGSQKKS
jgi:TPR repeat protein